jgi:hypothetical protein
MKLFVSRPGIQLNDGRKWLDGWLGPSEGADYYTF